MRGHLRRAPDALPAHDLLALTSATACWPATAWRKRAELGGADVVVLEGGNQAWTDAGLALEAGNDGLEASPVDAFLRPYDNDRSVEEAMQSYLDWEIALLEQHGGRRHGALPHRLKHPELPGHAPGTDEWYSRAGGP